MDYERQSEEEERAGAADAGSNDDEEDYKSAPENQEAEAMNEAASKNDGVVDEDDEDKKEEESSRGRDSEMEQDDDDVAKDEDFEEAVAEANRNLLASGCGKQAGERKKVVRAFWAALWPILEDLGWSKDEGRGKDEGLVFFKTPDQLEEFDRIKDVIDRVMLRKDPAEALAADAYEANLAMGGGSSSSAGGVGGGSTPKAALSSSAARRAAVLPISRSRKKTAESAATSGTEEGGAGGEDKSTSSSMTEAPGDKKGGSKAAAANKSNKSAAGATLLDVSWKEGGKSFPKRSSAIGNRHQVSRIPDAGTYDPDQQPPESEKFCTLIWSPSQAEERGVNDKTIADLPPGIKEAALFRLAELGYDENALVAGLKSIKPTDGSTWGQERRDKFRDEIFRSRKDLKAVCKAMRIPMKTCLAYYYGTYKFSDDYRLLKTVCGDEEAMRMESNEHEFDACAVCGDGGNLLICDGCEGEYHMECCRPPLRTVPEGNWLCDECVDRKFLAARQYVIKSSRLFERHHGSLRPPDAVESGADATTIGKKRGLDDAGLPDGVEKVMYKPTDAVLSAVRKFAKGLNQLFVTGRVNVDGGQNEEAVKDEIMEDASTAEVPGVATDAPARSVPTVEGS